MDYHKESIRKNDYENILIILLQKMNLKFGFKNAIIQNIPKHTKTFQKVPLRSETALKTATMNVAKTE